jgi:hypothetical protein
MTGADTAPKIMEALLEEILAGRLGRLARKYVFLQE